MSKEGKKYLSFQAKFIKATLIVLLFILIIFNMIAYCEAKEFINSIENFFKYTKCRLFKFNQQRKRIYRLLKLQDLYKKLLKLARENLIKLC